MNGTLVGEKAIDALQTAGAVKARGERRRGPECSTGDRAARRSQGCRAHGARRYAHVDGLRADVDQAAAFEPHIGIEQAQIVGRRHTISHSEVGGKLGEIRIAALSRRLTVPTKISRCSRTRRRPKRCGAARKAP